MQSKQPISGVGVMDQLAGNLRHHLLQSLQTPEVASEVALEEAPRASP